jgi:hypothetical protein
MRVSTLFICPVPSKPLYCGNMFNTMIQFWNYEFLCVVLEAGEMCQRMCKELFIASMNMGGYCEAYCSKTIDVRAHRTLRCSYGHVAYSNQHCVWQQHIMQHYQICVKSSKATLRSHSIINWWVKVSFVLLSVCTTLVFWLQSSVLNIMAAQLWLYTYISWFCWTATLGESFACVILCHFHTPATKLWQKTNQT